MRRRFTGATPSSVVQTADFTVDFARRRVSKPDGTEIHLTPTEWGLVEQLERNPGKLVTQRQLLQAVWGPEYGSELEYLRSYVRLLRKKIETDPARPEYILTEPWVGYRFNGLPEFS